MTAHVLGPVDTGPGVLGGTKLALSASSTKPLTFAVFDYNMGTDNYTVGGNDIADLWDPTKGGFTTVLFIGIEQKDTNTAADNRYLRIDYTAKTLLLYTAVTTEGTAADQGVVACRLLVVGYR